MIERAASERSQQRRSRHLLNGSARAIKTPYIETTMLQRIRTICSRGLSAKSVPSIRFHWFNRKSFLVAQSSCTLAQKNLAQILCRILLKVILLKSFFFALAFSLFIVILVYE
jgi:hypothetical protein